MRRALLKPPSARRLPKFWSVSRYNTWRDCPYQYLLKHVLKFPEEKHPAMERGIAIHAKLEQFLLGNIKGIPNELAKLAKEIGNLKKHKVEPEVSWTLTKDCEQTHPKDWDGAWVRAKIDAHHYWPDDELLIIDLKTGRVKLAKSQMDLYAAMSQFYYPNAKKIRVENWFSDHGEIEGDDYTPRRARELWTRWVKRAKDMLADRTFRPKPGSACRRCPFRSDKIQPDNKAGPCGEWMRARDE